jgi:hypothetical protein
MASQTKYATITTEIAGGGVEWSAATLSPCLVTADDDLYAASGALELDQSTKSLFCSGFKFEIPHGADNFEITAFALCKASAADAAVLIEAALWHDGVQKNLVNPAIPQIAVTDSETDLLATLTFWSVTPFSPDTLNDDSFGVSLQFQATAECAVYVEQVGITITFDPRQETRTAMFHDLYDGGDTGLKNWSAVGSNVLYATDSKYASCTLDNGETSEWLEGRSFGFSSAIAYDMTVLGIEVEVRIRAYGDDSQGLYDSAVRLRTASGTYIGDDKKSATEYDNSADYVTRTYGGSDDMWGLDATEITPAMVRNYLFGVALAYTRTSGTGSMGVTVDKVTLRIYFGTMPDEPAHGTTHGGGRHARTRRGIWGKRYKR